MNQIIFTHLYNDRSGSPRVLASVIDAVRGQRDLILYVGAAGSGVLDDAGVETTKFFYARTPAKLLNAAIFFVSQLVLFVRLLLDRRIQRDAVIYVNTILPFGAALFGALTGRRVFYHLHEVSISPRILMRLLVAFARRTASNFVYVSQFHMDALPIHPERSTLLPNAVDLALYEHSLNTPVAADDPRFRILMLASLKDYKGIPEFIRLAERLKQFSHVDLTLVANASEQEIADYFGTTQLPSNVSIFSVTASPWIFYSKADLLLNMSRVDQWIETFGMTIIEAMCFGVPSIAPPLGGPREIIRDGVDGFLVDSRNADEMFATVVRLVTDNDLLKRMKLAARERSKEYSPVKFLNRVKELLS